MDDVDVDDAQPAARICPSCGASLRADAKFCATCGNWLGAPEAVEELDELDELDELQEPDEIEEITELHAMLPPPRPGVQPVSLSREPMTAPRRVLLAIALLMLFGAIAVALRTVG